MTADFKLERHRNGQHHRHGDLLMPGVALLDEDQMATTTSLSVTTCNIQGGFRYVTTGLVSQWERGEKRPQGASLKLLALVAKNGLQAVA